MYIVYVLIDFSNNVYNLAITIFVIFFSVVVIFIRHCDYTTIE